MNGFMAQLVSISFTPFAMDGNKKKKDGSTKEQPAASPDAKRGPVKTITLENVHASIFVREHVVQGEPHKFYSVSFTRSYKDASGRYQYTKSFDLDDLGRLITVATQAAEFIREQEQQDAA